MDKGAVLDWGREALNIESKELENLSLRLDETFVEVVDLILRSEGKVVVTGLGKSGHIGRKIAATLSSTGTPAFFLHPGEALHGDLGVIEKKDVLLAIAYGGETFETIEVAKYARRLGLKITSLTGKPGSSLASLSDVVLNGQVNHEACPLQLAPTSSTTVGMALGDAIAVALMKARGFQEQDFAQYHPGGSLGRRLSLVSDHMQKDILTLFADDNFDQILEVITARNLGIAAVVNRDGSLVGAITDGDLRRAIIKLKDQVFKATAADLMSNKPKTISAGGLAVNAVKDMEDHSISSLFVVDENGKPDGLVRMYDLLAAKIV